MLFPNEIPFNAAALGESLSGLPATPAVFALRGERGEPYLNRTTNLRRRLTRLLTPSPVQTRRLQLAGMVRHLAWVETTSDFEALLTLYSATAAVYGAEAAKRLHLRAPCFLRMSMRNRYPRLYATTSVTEGAANDLFGPFASRPAAERYAEQVLDLYLLRRCFQDLDPDPAFPGCIYSEMKKCLAPCYAGCTDVRYAEEATAVHAFLRTRGQSLLDSLAGERERASDALQFEAAAQLHERHVKVQSVAALVPELAGALGAQFGILVQPAVLTDHVALYQLASGVFTGPVLFSTLGMRLPNESSGSSSLFAHPAAFAPVPLEGTQADALTDNPETRLGKALAELASMRTKPPGRVELCDHQSLLARWYFRPERKRQGDLVLAPATSTAVPIKPLLRTIARVFHAHAERLAPPGGTGANAEASTPDQSVYF